ncbi:MAG TPA: RNA-binding cell elongation regulator Jag/EloR [Aggregatilineales bacterium]|nr:RNA-binding cell elongation regulator Jag/EloR [Aggregatilineales bacterium]
MSDASIIEVTAPDIESAIAKGIAELGVSREDVIVEVLEEPTRRLLGLGTKQAKVRLTVIGMRAKAPPTPAVPATPGAPAVEMPVERDAAPTRHTGVRRSLDRVPPDVEKPVETIFDQEKKEAEDAPKARPEPVAKPFQPPTRRKPHDRVAPDVEEPEEVDAFDFEDEAPELAEVSEDELASEAKIGAETLRELLRRMQVEAKVAAHPADTDGNEAPHWILEIHGRDLGNLIGRKGETLSALQYITRLITSKELNRRANLVIDVEGYKSRRETMLRRLAKRMADQALQHGRTVQLEPMPPHERRIIHLTLRDYPGVRTESVGDGDRRKVTIIPEKK